MAFPHVLQEIIHLSQPSLEDGFTLEEGVVSSILHDRLKSLDLREDVE